LTNGDSKGKKLKKIGIFIVMLCLATLTLCSCAEKAGQTSGTGQESGFTLTKATPLGVTASAIVELEDMYHSPETYDVRITVLEVLRGEKSADLIKSASASNAPAQNGFEYVLARIRFEYSARGAPGDKTWVLSGEQFNAFSNDGKPYENPAIVLPEPVLGGVLRSGDSQQGWVAFEVKRQDKKPLMIFSPGNVWFQLY
jgi:hypothetical protein